MSVPSLILTIAAAYLTIGAFIATLFVTRFLARHDPVAAHSPWSFRVAIWPGCAALWPLLIVWIRHALRTREVE